MKDFKKIYRFFYLKNQLLPLRYNIVTGSLSEKRKNYRKVEIMFKKIWHEEMIQNHILERQGKEALNSHYYATTYPDVYAAAERTFGSWGEAIESCGIDYNTIRKYKSWTKQGVLDEVRRLAKANEPLHSQYAQNNYKPLYMASIKRFKNWGHTVTSHIIPWTLRHDISC